ncbi:helix-turn-helix domain-containing protein [Thermodesulfobacteriota bacterium]
MSSDRQEFRKYFDVLELSTDATLREIKESYNFLKGLYSGESIATMSAEGDISPEKRAEILEQVEEAYTKVLVLFKGEILEQDQSVLDYIAGIEQFDGQTMQVIREKMGVQLPDVSKATRVLLQHLENIEADNYAALPVPVYTRGFVAAYAKHLLLDADRVTRDFMKRFAVARQDNL